MSGTASGHWREQPEGGTRWAYAFMCWLALHLGRRFSRGFLWLAAVYFFLRRGDERRHSRDYLRRVLGRPVRSRDVIRHLHCYAVMMLDRIYFLTRGEQPFEIEVEGVEQLVAYCRQGRGVLLLGSHQGSFDALRTLAERYPDAPLRVVLDRQKTRMMTETMEALSPGFAQCVIDSSQSGIAITLAIAQACGEGAMVALLADRAREHETLQYVDFLGDPAPFPTGPWLLAHTLQVPVMLCFGVYLGGNRYRLVFESIAEQLELPRASRDAALHEVIRRYAARMEYYARLAPYNWYNLYDFWQSSAGDKRAQVRRMPRVQAEMPAEEV